MSRRCIRTACFLSYYLALRPAWPALAAWLLDDLCGLCVYVRKCMTTDSPPHPSLPCILVTKHVGLCAAITLFLVARHWKPERNRCRRR